jgi:dsRNA-specific ribonuclease
MATSHYLYTTYSDFQEGMLTNMRAALVRTESLGETASTTRFCQITPHEQRRRGHRRPEQPIHPG